MKKLSRSWLLGVGALVMGYSLGTVSRQVDPRSISPRITTVVPARNDDGQSREEAVTGAASALLNRGAFRALAQIGDLLETLDSAQLSALADKIDAMPLDDREVLLPRFIGYWTKRDSEGATKWMYPRLLRYSKERWFGGMFATGETNLVNEWAENAPEQAIEFARQHVGTGLSGLLLSNAIHHWPDKDDAHRFEVLRAYPPGQDRQRAMVSFCFTWAQSDAAGALAAVKALPPGPERDGALSEILGQWARSDTGVALEQVKALGLNSIGVMAVMTKEGAKSNPAMLAKWFESQPAEMVPQLGPVLVRFWAARDPVAAFQWAAAHGVSIVESAANAVRELPAETFLGHRFEFGIDTPLTAAMQANPDATLGWIRALPPGPDRERYLEMLAGSDTDISKVQPILSELSGEAAARAAQLMTAALASKDFDQARDWAASLPIGANREAAWTALGAQRSEPLDLPPGPDRDAMFSGLATAHYQDQPVKSLDRVMQIDNPTLRRRTFDDVMSLIARGNIELGYGGWINGVSEGDLKKVQEWLTKSSVPEDWKKQWRKPGQ